MKEYLYNLSVTIERNIVEEMILVFVIYFLRFEVLGEFVLSHKIFFFSPGFVCLVFPLLGVQVMVLGGGSSIVLFLLLCVCVCV